MTRERLLLVAGGLLGLVVVAALLLAPEIGEELAPEPRRAWVAVQPAGAAVATVGRVELVAGTAFTLHAVLEAVDRQGERLYYTGAPALVVGGERVPAERLRRWDRREEAKILWFTVEGERPYLSVESADDLRAVTFGELFRADWPQAWSVPGDLEPHHDDHIERAAPQEDRPFGTQRFHARVELFDPANPTLPQQRFKSPGAAEVRSGGDGEVATGVASLPGVAGPPSRVFGLTQVEAPAGAADGLAAAVERLARDEIAFSTPTVLRETARAAGLPGVEALSWRPATLAGSLRWGADVRQGDLLRAGDRFAVLHRDAGAAGALDGEDLALAFDHGAAVVPLSAVFPDGQPVELAAIAPR